MENSRASSWAKSWKMARHHWGLASDAGPLMNAFNSWTSREFPAMLGVFESSFWRMFSRGRFTVWFMSTGWFNHQPLCIVCFLCFVSMRENFCQFEIHRDIAGFWKKNDGKTGTQRNRNQGMHKCKKGPCIAMKGAKVYFSLPFFEFRIHIPVPFLVMTSHDSLDFPNFDFLWMYLKIRDLQNPRRKIMCWDSKCDMLHIKFTWNLRTNLWVDWFHEGDYDYKL